jgi:hypothetical protein
MLRDSWKLSTLILIFQKNFGDSSNVGLSWVLPILKPCSFGLHTLFKIQKPLGLVQNQVQFHGDITHSPILNILYR